MRLAKPMHVALVNASQYSFERHRLLVVKQLMRPAFFSEGVDTKTIANIDVK